MPSAPVKSLHDLIERLSKAAPPGSKTLSLTGAIFPEADKLTGYFKQLQLTIAKKSDEEVVDPGAVSVTLHGSIAGLFKNYSFDVDIVCTVPEPGEVDMAFTAALTPKTPPPKFQEFVDNLSTLWPSLPNGLGNAQFLKFGVAFKLETATLTANISWPLVYGTSIVAIAAGVTLKRSGTSPDFTYTGSVSGALMVDSLRVAVIYGWETNSESVTYQIGFGGATINCTYSVDEGWPILTANLGGVSFGGILAWLIHLARPGASYTLPAPWSVLYQLTFDSLSLTIDYRWHKTSVAYSFNDLSLGFLTLKNINLTYQDFAGQQTVVMRLNCEFYGEPYGDPPNIPLTWDILNQDPPSPPGEGDKLLDLRFLGMGQNVVFSDTTNFNSVSDAVTEMQQVFSEPDDPSVNPLPSLPKLKFSPSGNWLIGTDFTIMSAVSIMGVFNDPSLYGIHIALAGPKMKSLDGLELEILYKKVTDSIGLYHTELTLPDSMRHMEFGAVNVTMPIITVDIFTNGDFRVDFGFPTGGDFSRSFSLTAGEFTGAGGFYFGRLNGATSRTVPAITNGRFSPVIEFGLGLSAGLGRTFTKGPLSAGLQLSLQAIIEGTLAWFNPNDAAKGTDLFYRIQGTAALVGVVFGSVDFGIIKADVHVTARASITLILESYEPIEVDLDVSVEVEASIEIAFITISFSFSTSLSFSFTIGSHTTPPWAVAAADPKQLYSPLTLRQQRTRHLPRSVKGAIAPISFDWSPRLVFPAVQVVPLWAMPSLTVALLPDSQTPQLQGVMTLLAENGITPGARTAREIVESVHENAIEKPFVRIADGMLRWAISAARPNPANVVTLGQLQAINEYLGDRQQRDTVFTYGRLSALMQDNFQFQVGTTLSSITPMQAAPFPMIPELQMQVGARNPVYFKNYAVVPPGYRDTLETYYDQMRVNSGAGPQSFRSADDSESLSTLVFSDYLALLTQQSVQNAIDLMQKYPYQPAGTESLKDIDQSFDGPSIEALAAANQDYPLNPGVTLPIDGVKYQARNNETLGSVAQRFGFSAQDLVGPTSMSANYGNAALLLKGSAVTIQPLYYEVTALDMAAPSPLDLIAATYYVRSNQPQAPSITPAIIAWYVGAITSANPQWGTTLTVPTATIANGVIQQTGTFSYGVRGPHDTAGLIAEALALSQLGAAWPQFVTFKTQSIAPQQFQAGTYLTISNLAYTVQGGETFADVAARFTFSDNYARREDLANANATKPILAPLAVLAMPEIVYRTGQSDTLAAVSRRYDLTVGELADRVQTVAGIMSPYSATQQAMTVPQVASRDVDQLVNDLVVFGRFNSLSAQASRYLMHGMRVPAPSAPDGPLSGLYQMDGQQFGITGPEWVFFNNPSSAPWIGLTSGGYLGPTLAIPIDQNFLTQWSPDALLDQNVSYGPMTLYREVPPRYSFEQTVHWQAAANVVLGPTGLNQATGEPSLWIFPDSLMSAEAGATAQYELVTTKSLPGGGAKEQPLNHYAWAMAVPLRIKRAPSVAAPLPNAYLMIGADQSGRDLLLNAWRWLEQSGAAADIELLYTPSIAGGNPQGLASNTLNPAKTFVLKTNLSTVTHSNEARLLMKAASAMPPGDYYAGVASPARFLKFIWEASITGSGGYYLNYADISGNALPNTIFAASDVGTVWLLMTLNVQSQWPAPDRVLRPFNNCAIVTDNIDAASTAVFAQSDPPLAGTLRRIALVQPGNVGFQLQRGATGQGPSGEALTRSLYSMAGYGVALNGDFAASHDALPAGPQSVTGGYAYYDRVIPIAQFGFVNDCPGSSALPPSAANPYRGITGPVGTQRPLSSALVTLAIHDIYGNTTQTTKPMPPMSIPVGYTDEIIGVSTWPGAGFDFVFSGSGSPQLDTSLSLQSSKYIPGGGISCKQASSTAAADGAKYNQLFYQVFQHDLGYAWSSNIGVPQAATGDLKAAMNGFVIKSALFTSAAAAVQQQSYIIASGNTISFIANLLGCSPAALLRENADVSAITGGSYTKPVVAAATPMNTLTALCAATPGLTPAALAANNANQPLTPAITLLTNPQQYTLPASFAAGDNTLLAVAGTLQCNVYVEVPSPSAPVAAGVLWSNWTATSLIAPGLTISIRGVSVTTDASSTFASLFAQFASLNLTVAAFATNIESLDGIFQSSKTISYTDFIVPAAVSTKTGPLPQFTLANMPATAGTLAQLAALNQSVPNFYYAGTAIFISSSVVPAQPGDTFASLAQNAAITIDQFAAYNGATPLAPSVVLAIPNLVAWPAGATLYGAYTPRRSDSLASIAATFGDVQTIGAFNREIPGIFATGASITAGGHSVTATANDSLQSVYGQMSGLTYKAFIDAIAPQTNVLRTNGAVVVPNAKGSGASLNALAQGLNIDPVALLTANRSLQQFFAQGATIVSPGGKSVTVGSYDTADTITYRFAQESEPVTIADLVSHNGNTAGLMTNGTPIVVPVAATAISCPFQPVIPPAGATGESSVIFPVDVSVTMTRAQALVSPQFASSTAVYTNSSPLAPRMTASGSGGITVEKFAQQFEQAFAPYKLKCATSRKGANAAANDATSRHLWAVSFGPQGISHVAVQANAPRFYALEPLSTNLISEGATVSVYESGSGFVSQVSKNYQSVDLDDWMEQFLSTVDLVLTPPYAVPAFQYGITGPVGLAATDAPFGPASYETTVAAKNDIASVLRSRVSTIISQVAANDYYDDTARETLYQQMLVTLSEGYSVSAVVEVPVSITSPFTTGTGPAGPFPPRLSGKVIPVVYTLPGAGSPNSIASVAAHYSVSPAYFAQVIAGMQGLLKAGVPLGNYTTTGTDTLNDAAKANGVPTDPSLATYWVAWSNFIGPIASAGVFKDRANFTLSSSSRPVYASDTLGSLADYFNRDVATVARANDLTPNLVVPGAQITLPQFPNKTYSVPAPQSLAQTLNGYNAQPPATTATLDQLAFGAASASPLLAPNATVAIVETLPDLSLSTSKVTTGAIKGAIDPALAFLLTVKNERGYQKIALNLDYVINEIEYNIQAVPQAGSYQSSSWLTFVLPIGSTMGVPLDVDTSIPQLQVPLPLRAYPRPPMLIAQDGEPHTPSAPTIADARLWDYSFDFAADAAAQDTQHVIVQFSNNGAGPRSLFAKDSGPSLFAWLATFSDAYPALKDDLSRLTTPAGPFDSQGAYAMQSLATIANGVASALKSGASFNKMHASPGATLTYEYEMHTLGNDVSLQQLDLHIDQHPPGATLWPDIFVQPPAGGAFLPLTSNNNGIYEYPPGIPAGEAHTYRFRFENRDVVSSTDAWSGVYIDRNAQLLTGPTAPIPTNPAFIYETPVVRFIEPMIPLLDDPATIDISGSKAPLSTHIANMLTSIISSIPTNLEIVCKYGMILVPGTDLMSVTPIRLVPMTFMSDVPGFASLLAGSLEEWKRASQADDATGVLLFEVTAFTQPPSGGYRPVLRLRDLQLKMTSIDWSA